MTANQTGSYTGKVAFVTGAGSGIGRAAALAFAREGASVVAADVSEQGSQETARMIEEAEGRALAVTWDVTHAEDVKRALDRTIETFGRLDAAFNNAGVGQKSAVTAELQEEEWDRVVDTEMMDRVTGDTPEGRAAVIAQEPIGRMGTPEEIAAAVLWLC